MSYILKSLRKLEEERRRVKVAEMTLFRGLSERWQSEKPVWRYLLVLSLVVNIGIIAWLLATFVFGVGSNKAGKTEVKIIEPTPRIEKKPVALPDQNILKPDPPAKLSLEVTPSPKAGTQEPSVTEQKVAAEPQQRKAEGPARPAAKTNSHAPKAVLPADEIETHHNGAKPSPNVIIWKDEKGVIHYSGTAGGN
jgi:phage shock protein PspC (stress-responsive transcriptional regulator)